MVDHFSKPQKLLNNFAKKNFSVWEKKFESPLGQKFKIELWSISFNFCSFDSFGNIWLGSRPFDPSSKLKGHAHRHPSQKYLVFAEFFATGRPTSPSQGQNCQAFINYGVTSEPLKQSPAKMLLLTVLSRLLTATALLSYWTFVAALLTITMEIIEEPW